MTFARVVDTIYLFNRVDRVRGSSQQVLSKWQNFMVPLVGTPGSLTGTLHKLISPNREMAHSSPRRSFYSCMVMDERRSLLEWSVLLTNLEW